MNMSKTWAGAAADDPKEFNRLKAVKKYKDLSNLKSLEQVVTMVSVICKTPIAFISLVDDTQQTFIAKTGIDSMGSRREDSFCHYTIGQSDLLIVEDASSHPLFYNNPHVTGNPYIRFYAGMPIQTYSGQAIGSLCVVDRESRQLTDFQKECIKLLSAHVIDLIELRFSLDMLNEQHDIVTSAEYSYKDKFEAQNEQMKYLSRIVFIHMNGPVTSMKEFIKRVNTSPAAQTKEYLPVMNLILDQMDEAVNDVFTSVFSATL